MNDKFSVIIPTIWKSKFTIELLERYSKCQFVDEIILIDNAPDENRSLSIEKIIHIREEKNTFVNPAWNKGVALAQNDNITISNDDILFDINLYYYLLNQIVSKISLKDLGYIGSHSDNYIYNTDKQPVLEKYNNISNTGGWGCLFSFDKNNWKPIPDELKIWYGDNWIHSQNNKILQLRGINIETKMSTSSDLIELRSVRDNDTYEWYRILQK